MVNLSDFDGMKEMSVAFHFVRQLMLKLASMLCVGIGRIVCSTSLQLCLCIHSTTNLCIT